MPQPADVVWILWAATVLFSLGINSPVFLSRRTRLACSSAGLLLFWVVAVSFVNSALFAGVEIMRHSLFYVFNVLVFIAVIALGDRDPARFSRLVSLAATGALCVVLIGLAVSYDGSAVRQSGGFNNPNQMAYFTLLICGIFVLATPAAEIWGVRGLVVFGSALAIVGFSASLTVMAAIFIVLLAAALKVNKLAALIRVTGSFVVLLVIGRVILTVTQVGGELGATVLSRIAVFERKSEDVAVTRGYNRIWEFPEYIPFGAGEGGLSRFGFEHQLEIHSSWGTLLFSYGIVGLGLFCMLLFILLRRRPLWVWLVVLAPSLYGLTHQGLRTTALWVLLGCVGWVVVKAKTEPEKQAPSRNPRIIRGQGPHTPQVLSERVPK